MVLDTKGMDAKPKSVEKPTGELRADEKGLKYWYTFKEKKVEKIEKKVEPKKSSKKK